MLFAQGLKPALPSVAAGADVYPTVHGGKLLAMRQTGTSLFLLQSA